MAEQEYTPTEAEIRAAHEAFWASGDVTGGHEAIGAALRAAAEVRDAGRSKRVDPAQIAAAIAEARLPDDWMVPASDAIVVTGRARLVEIDLEPDGAYLFGVSRGGELQVPKSLVASFATAVGMEIRGHESLVADLETFMALVDGTKVIDARGSFFQKDAEHFDPEENPFVGRDEHHSGALADDIVFPVRVVWVPEEKSRA
ncbi:hypothetical protein [Pseudoclavibacter sp. 8L]|uniref:hypothetical protein n=1 Tax=Pseudoclavibacter sp. 8L TaxID=2653162 RepID=UPI0012F2D72D|nr:hypothetical protein [Pseudoclavibacter sp. 8L]VXB34074.1 hypothetical protein PSCLAVI8L_130518 [Pseudoclavibacter sp. 8L]